MKIQLEKQVAKNIESGKFDEAMYLIKQFPPDELENMLLRIGYESQSVLIYAFVCYLVSKKECVEYHLIAESILCGPLCYIKGSYVTALYHNKRVLEIESDNTSAKLMMLFFNALPVPLVSDDEAKKMAYEILEVEPQNSTALQFIK